MSKIRVLDQSGHRELSWSSDNQTQIAAALAMFTAAKDAGLQALVDTDGGGSFRHADEFDPAAHEIVMRRPLVGG